VRTGYCGIASTMKPPDSVTHGERLTKQFGGLNPRTRFLSFKHQIVWLTEMLQSFST